MDKSIGTHTGAFMTPHFKSIGINVELPHSSGKLSTRFWRVSVGIFAHSGKRAFVRSDTDVGREGLAHNLRSSSSQRCLMGLRSGLCEGQSSSSTPNSPSQAFMDLALCTGAQSCWNRKGSSPNCSHKVGSVQLSKMSWFC